jgi:hypothetical protein
MKKNRLIATDQNGLVYILDTGAKTSENMKYNELSDDKDLISQRVFSILSKNDYIEIYSDESITVRFKRDFNITEVLLETLYAEQLLSEKNEAYKYRNKKFTDIITDIIESKYKSDRAFKDKLISQIKDFLGENIYINYNEIKEMPNYNESNVRILAKHKLFIQYLFNYDIREKMELIQTIEDQISMEVLYGAESYNSRITYTYNELRDLVAFSFNFDDFNIKGTSIIQEYLLVKYTDQVLNDPLVSKIVKNGAEFKMFGSITKMTNKNLSLLVASTVDTERQFFSFVFSYNNFRSFFPLMELYKRGMRREIESLKMTRDEKLHIFRPLYRSYPEYILYYKEQLKIIKDEILKDSNDSTISAILEVMQTYNDKNFSAEDIVDFVFESDEDFNSFNFLRERSFEYKKQLILNHMSKKRYEITFLTDNDSKTLIRSQIATLYQKIWFFTEIMVSGVDHGEVLTREVCETMFKGIASGSSSERKIALRTLSLFLHTDKLNLASTDSEIDSTVNKQKIRIFMEELSKSTLRNTSLESMMKKPIEVYGNNNSYYWFIKRTTQNGKILGRDYTDIYSIIESSESVRDIIKSSLLLLTLN